MVLVAGVLSWQVALTLLRHHVNKDRTFFGITNIFQHWQQVVEVVSINRANIIKAKLFKQSTTRKEATCKLFSLRCFLLQWLWKRTRNLFGCFAEACVGLAGNKTCKARGKSANWRSNRHIVIVQNNDQARIQRASVVHGLISHAS